LKTIALTTYFNPLNFQTKKRNYEIFKKDLEQKNIPLFTIESTLAGYPFHLQKDQNTFQLSGGSILWQKERLFNLGLRFIPKEVENIIWLDSDILFENTNWFLETEEKLNQYGVVQPFSEVYRMKKDIYVKTKSEEHWLSFALQFNRNPTLCSRGDFILHGHSGFAWGIKRKILDTGKFYDACVAGSGDHMMAHAFVGDWDSPCINRILGENSPHKKHYLEWCKKIYPSIKANLGFVEGKIYHLWHGDIENRKYVKRNIELESMQFDPKKHLTVDASGLYKWTKAAKHFEAWAKQYFMERLEDGNI
jgi:hypothetical protein